MGEYFRELARSGIVVVAVLGAGAAFMIMGVAGVAMRAECPQGTAILGCAPSVDPVVTGSTEPPVRVEAALEGQELVFDPRPVSGHAIKLRQADTLIAATFANLTQPRPMQAMAAEAAAAERSAASVGALATRVVRSVRIGPEGAPVWPASAYAEAMDRVPDPAAVAAASTALSSAVPDEQATPVMPAIAALRPPSSEKPATTPMDVRTVKGQGVNVRSGPSNKNRRLFALKGGSEVTVGTEKSGWLEITDSKGRTGWAYSSYLSR